MNTLRRADQADSLSEKPVRSKVGRPLAAVISLLLSATSLQAQTAAQAPDAVTPGFSNSALTAPLFYQLLLGELNVRGGDAGAGYSLLLDAARKQRDPALFRRAVEVALQNRSGEAALSAARAWSTDLPQDAEADRYLLQILLALNRVGETAPVLRAIVERSAATERNNTLNAIPQTYARVPDKAAALKVVREALTDSLSKSDRAAAAWTTIGRMQLAAEQVEPALASMRQGHAADPASPFPALLALELFERGQADAEAVILRHLNAAEASTGPREPSVALTYSRVLLDLQRSAEARTQLDALTARHPDIPEPWLLLATLQVQSDALPAATRSLQTYMTLARQSGNERTARGLTQAYLLMAQIAEKQQDFPAANAWLDRIENADDIMAAQMRRASLLARQGQLEQARALLRNQPERREGDARLKLVAEAQLLRDFKQFQASFDVYGEAVKRFPDDADLLYEQAMMAEKADRLPDMERLLRQLIAAKPDYHHAYNALGYSLADRNIRLPEAKQLIEKAVSLAPNDAYIQDSLAWVEYRLGNNARALEILQAAYAKRPDAEIAAHLGEVLWVKGQREQALKIWREGLLLASDNETLQSTLKRFQVTP
ncbi:tetratricopeptide repeat protein [Hydrogenophaga sp.]|uniref:tetratricopeptide repeat protein n=1 Tax=Hydrogenophaga sp. TaxID=1904254 RepID=UPI0025C4535B|nr:tetratricopeptide repeat protein [Hydrogenophaga sp.]